jgi:molybdopterin converting factor small subunit
MNFFVGGELVRNLAHPIAPGDEVHILGALSGG